MPNTPVRAAAEGMPSITRRKALTLSGALAATAAASAIPALTAEREHPWVKARRLCRELSSTLAECDGGEWKAEVYAPGSPHPILFVNAEWERERLGVSRELSATIDAHRKAWSALSAVGDHDNASRREACKIEFAAALAVLGYRCQSIAELHAKGDYLAAHPWIDGCELDPEEADALIRSMTSGGTV